MILSQLMTYLSEHRRAALVDLSHALAAAPDALRGMLAVLERKGCVRRLTVSGGCSGGCAGCTQRDLEVYEWVGP